MSIIGTGSGIVTRLPACSRVRLAGGLLVIVVVAARVVVVVVVGVVDGVSGHRGGVGEGERDGGEPSGGAAGLGQVMPFKFSGQYSLTLLYRYHCRWLESPDGRRTGGS